MRILTQNCWGVPIKKRRKRFDIIAKTIQKRPYDIVCLQEVFLHRWYEQSFKELHNYHHSYKKGVISLNGGLLTLTRQKPKEVTFHRYEVQGDIFSQQITDAALGKGFLETIIEDDNKEITVINVHNVSIYRANYHQKMYLTAQAEQLQEHVRRKVSKGNTVILAGDLNVVRGSILYSAFAKLLNDAASSLESQLDFIANQETEKVQHIHYNFTKLPENQHGSNLDFVFANMGETKKARYVTHFGHYPSDHPGIYVDINH